MAAHKKLVSGRSAAWLAVFLLASPAIAELQDDRAQTIDRFVDQFADFGMFDGTVVVDIGGERVYQASFGFAHAELGIRHEPDTRFRIASVSKMFTDVAFARLVDSGELDPDTPLARYLPDFPRANDISIAQLLDHSSGIPHSNDQPWGAATESMTLDEILAKLADLPLDFEPGSDRSYSNGGYAVAARVLVIITGKDFAGAMRQLVLDPLDLDNTNHIENARFVIDGMATGYTPGPEPGARAHPRFYAVETRPGGGSLYSTADDVLQFARAVFRSEFLSDESKRDVLGIEDGDYLSQGRSPGFVAKLLYRPESDTIVVSLANNYAVSSGWAEAIADIANGVVDSNPWPTLEGNSAPIRADDPRTGRYRSSFGDFKVNIRRSAIGHLVTNDVENGGTVALIPMADGAFLQPQYYQRCEQHATDRTITCEMLNSDPRFASVLTPIAD